MKKELTPEQKRNLVNWGFPYTTEYVVHLLRKAIYKQNPKLFPSPSKNKE